MASSMCFIGLILAAGGAALALSVADANSTNSDWSISNEWQQSARPFGFEWICINKTNDGSQDVESLDGATTGSNHSKRITHHSFVVGTFCFARPINDNSTLGKDATISTLGKLRRRRQGRKPQMAVSQVCLMFCVNHAHC